MQTPLAIKMRGCRVLEKSWDCPKFPNYCVPSDLYRTRCHKQARPPPSHDALAEMAIGEELFNIQSPVETVKAASETAMREVIARSEIQSILTEGRHDLGHLDILLEVSNSLLRH